MIDARKGRESDGFGSVRVIIGLISFNNSFYSFPRIMPK